MKALGKGSIASIVRIGLQIAWVLLWVLAGLLVLTAAGYGITLLLIANGVIDPAAISANSGTLRVNGNEVPLSPNSAGTAWPIVAPAFLIGGVAIAGSLVIVWRLRKLFDSFSSGEPFRRENATHLRVIWITMILIEVARYILTASTAALLMSFGDEHGVGVADVELTIDLSTWGAILILIVLAEVFREGARLKEEQELTI
jgi:hypothetical protein